MKTLDTVILRGGKVWLSEQEADPDALYAKFLVCDFSVNGNGVRLDRDTIDAWVSTLKDQPLVGKIAAKSDGSVDFTGHNVRIVERLDEAGNSYNDVEFDTSAFGTFVDVGIEDVDGTECIVATAKVWRRFHTAAELIESRCLSGDLHTSWEIAVDDAETVVENGGVVKVIHSGRFIGHCLLGRLVQPAYPNSGLLGVAEEGTDADLSRAIILDMLSLSERKDVEEMKKKTPEMQAPEAEEVLEPIVPEVSENTDVPSSNPETSEMTANDIYNKLYAKVREKHERWAYVAFWFPESHTILAHVDGDDELTFQSATYTVSETDVEVSEFTPVTLAVSVLNINDTVAQLNERCVESEQKIADLNATVAQLDAYRQRCEEEDARAAQAEHESAVSELRKYAEDSGRFTSEELASEEMTSVFDALDKAKVDGMIAERLVKSMREAPSVEVSEQKDKEPIENRARVIAPIFCPMSTPSEKGEAVRNFIRS